jgi:O-antigen ligase
MQKILEKTLFILLVVFFTLLPFHAFGITTINNFFLTPESPAPTWLKMWKEILFILITFFSLFFSLFFFWEKPFSIKAFLKSFDKLDKVVILFIFLALFISIIQKISTSNLIFGIKYTLFPLILFLIFRRIPEKISQKVLDFFQKYIIAFASFFIAIGFILFGISQFSSEFFVFLGYSAENSFHSLFKPLAYCQQISDTDICRAQSVMSGPNQLGAYLVFFISLLAGVILQKFFQKKSILQSNSQIIFLSILLFSGVFLTFLSFSRGAWLGLFFSGVFFLIFTPLFTKWTKIKIFSGILSSTLALIIAAFIFLPEISHKIVNRAASSSEHINLSKQGLEILTQNPFGKGLGSAGAASKYESEEGKLAVGFVPENWYLQIGIETGFIGIFLWVLILFLVMQKLVQKNVGAFIKRPEKNPENNNFPLSLASAIFGISIISFFLHSWESSAVAYSVWGMAGILLSKK